MILNESKTESKQRIGFKFCLSLFLKEIIILFQLIVFALLLYLHKNKEKQLENYDNSGEAHIYFSVA